MPCIYTYKIVSYSPYLQQVYHACHLWVDKNPMTLIFKPLQKGVQDVKFAGIAYQGLLVC